MKRTTLVQLTIGLLLCNNVMICGQINKKNLIKHKEISTPQTTISAEEFEKLGNLTTEYISFDFYHSLRIPDHHVQIKIEHMNGVNAKLTLKSEPAVNNQKWKHTVIDTTFIISDSDFQKSIEMFKKILSSDICDLNVQPDLGCDGTTYVLKYGNSYNSVGYEIWSPDYNLAKRKLTQFNKCCEFIKKLCKHSF